MRFCKECGNMLYIKLSTKESDVESLIYYCRKCGNEEKDINEDNICVSRTIIKKTVSKIDHMINEFTKLDPTLPRIKNMKCPEENCPSNEEGGASPEIIYLRYDDQNMKYVYLCGICDKIWKLDKN